MSQKNIQYHADKSNGPFQTSNVISTAAAYPISQGGGGYLESVICNGSITGTVVVQDMAEAATANLILNDQATSTAITVVPEQSLAAQPAYPRRLVVTPGGTTADVKAGNVVIKGTDWEGVAISENFAFLDNASTATNGTKRFKTVTEITFPVQDGAGATWDVGELAGELIATITDPVVGGVFLYKKVLLEGLYIKASATPDLTIVFNG